MHEKRFGFEKTCLVGYGVCSDGGSDAFSLRAGGYFDYCSWHIGGYDYCGWYFGGCDYCGWGLDNCCRNDNSGGA